MSATTLNLPYTRFVAQVSTAPARSKSTYLALMEENLAALQKCPWKEASDVPAALTDHDFTASTYISDAYDAFKMTGNYSASTMTEIAYAGMAAYRFKIPDSALVSGSEVALSSISLPVSRDRYLKSGVRVAAVLSDSAAPSADWDVVRGSGGILLSAQLPQTAAYLLAGAPGKDTPELAASSFTGLAETGHAYLWIYLTLEDYTEHWDMYSANEQRLYAVEGSAMLVGGSAEFTFAGEVAPDTPSAAAQTRLITTSYPSANVYKGTTCDVPSQVCAHRVFALQGHNCYVVVGGKNSVVVTANNVSTTYGAFAPGFGIRRISASDGTSILRVSLNPGYYQSDASSPPEADLDADWYDTDAAKVLQRGYGVTGLAVAPLHGATDIYPPSAANTYKWLSLYLSTKTDCWRIGYCTLTNSAITFTPQVERIADGGELMLVTSVQSAGPNSQEGSHNYSVECVSVGDGVIRVGDRSIPYEGKVTGLGSCAGMNSGSFLVAGDLVSVGGVPCSHVAKVFTLNDPITVSRLSIDYHDLTPNVYDNFRVVYAGGAYYALGDFTRLGNVECPYGVAKLTTAQVTAMNDRYIVDMASLGGNASDYVALTANRTAIEIR